MAIDKVVDSAFLDGGLKKIADAIREKSGSADALAFPDEMEAAVKAIEGGGAQSDWDQNDPTKPDYVKNRTHYSEIKEVVVEYVGEAGEVELDNFPKFTVGDTVAVIVDDVEHFLVAFEDYGVPAIGDPPEAIFEGTGELGWCIGNVDGEVLFIASEPHTIRYVGEVVHKMDEKYLPDTIPYLQDGYVPMGYVIPRARDVFKGALAVGGTYSTLANPYPNKRPLDLTLDEFNAMFNSMFGGGGYIPDYVIASNGVIAPVYAIYEENCILVSWAEHSVYSSTNEADFVGAKVDLYRAKIHEDAENPGTIVSEYAIIPLVNKPLT